MRSWNGFARQRFTDRPPTRSVRERDDGVACVRLESEESLEARAGVTPVPRHRTLGVALDAPT